ncbi:MAG: hypothetical protein U0269_29920 [Polyangiales bacterium]
MVPSTRVSPRRAASAAAVAAVMVVASCGPASSGRAPLGVNEVSILFPLPRTGTELGMLPLAYSQGERGELLPRTVYDQLPLLLTFGGPNAIYYSLRVVSVRLDPCFPGIGPQGPAPCQTQVRVVFQPITSGFDASMVASTDDAAIHAFYVVSRQELDAFADGLSALKAQHGASGDRVTLGPHPIIERQGLSGPFADGVRSLLLRYAGAQNLRRVTFMTLEQFRLRWMFGGFDIAADQTLSPMLIPQTPSATRQVFTNFDTTGGSFEHGEASPASGSPEELAAFFQSTTFRSLTAEQQRGAFRRTLTIENPTSHSPDTIDCVTCHVAPAARVWAQRELGLQPERETDRYFADGARYASADEPQTSTIALRAFGYVGRTPTVSRRTVNESVLVLRALSADRDR